MVKSISVALRMGSAKVLGRSTIKKEMFAVKEFGWEAYWSREHIDN